MKRYDHITLDYSKQPPMMTCKHCGGQHNLDDMIEEEVKPSPTVSPERLAEILRQCDCIGSLAPIPLWHDLAWDKYRLNIATKLSKSLDIREKE
jgi:hypothetical protein